MTTAAREALWTNLAAAAATAFAVTPITFSVALVRGPHPLADIARGLAFAAFIPRPPRDPAGAARTR
ncbi:hypothetical protein AMK15_28330 [Streptomyces sp. MJM1172]|nr:hypothetical protein AMK15_28330 [Streptomyces sp. MJM1172]